MLCPAGFGARSMPSAYAPLLDLPLVVQQPRNIYLSVLLDILGPTGDMVSPQVAPIAGFTAKLSAHGTKYYVNICAHPAIDRPMDAQDRPVSDDHLDSMGVDNLRVPLLTGPARVIGEDESVAMDVVFHPAVLRVSLPPEPQADDGPKQKRLQALGQHVRQRLVELALKNVEEDLSVKLNRDYTLPRNLKYKGGIGPEKRPMPLAVLRQMVAGKAAEAARKELAAAPGPWRSNRNKVGLKKREAPRIVELEEGSVLDAATKVCTCASRLVAGTAARAAAPPPPHTLHTPSTPHPTTPPPCSWRRRCRQWP